mmetsp:Transcript_48534/g.135644  ORF Transcript_48534/g.135644 Transcript_48534/m.135644 type:complete len:236 (+) Transcript_48534:90-797(+)
MPIIAPKKPVDQADRPKGQRMSADEELMLICGWGKCERRLEKVLKMGPNINHKNDEGMTPLHVATGCSSAVFVKRLLEEKADPNVPATSSLSTPLDVAIQKLEFEEERDRFYNNFETINRMDDTSIATRPDLKILRKCKELLEAAGGVQGNCRDSEPNIAPDGSINGGPPSELRSYTPGEDGSYTAAHQLRSGKYDVLKYENGMLVRAQYDPKTGHWDVGQGMTCKDPEPDKTSP